MLRVKVEFEGLRVKIIAKGAHSSELTWKPTLVEQEHNPPRVLFQRKY